MNCDGFGWGSQAPTREPLERAPYGREIHRVSKGVTIEG